MIPKIPFPLLPNVQIEKVVYSPCYTDATQHFHILLSNEYTRSMTSSQVKSGIPKKNVSFDYVFTNVMTSLFSKFLSHSYE